MGEAVVLPWYTLIAAPPSPPKERFPKSARQTENPELPVPAPPFADAMLTPGALVRHPEREDWGLGQVQSVVGTRITVNFENAGKQLINGAVVHLVVVAPERE